MRLLIDDIRNIPSDFIARTDVAGIMALRRMYPSISELIIDHDLGCKKNGYQIVVWAIESDFLPEKVRIVTSNPVGRSNIIAALINNGYLLNYSDQTYFKPKN